MNKLSLKNRFLKAGNKFRTDDFNLVTIASIIDEIRYSVGELTTDEVRLLLEIPISVLKDDVDLRDEPLWYQENMEYFAGNLCIEDDFGMELRKKVLDGNCNINDMLRSLEYVKDNYNSLINRHGRNVELILRNPEVALREDCIIVNGDKFRSKGELFANYIDKAINL